MFGNNSRRYIIVTGDDRDHEDGFRRDGMRRRMLNSGQFRGNTASGSRENAAYDEGYKRGYEHAWKDHERLMEGGEEAMRTDTRYGW